MTRGEVHLARFPLAGTGGVKLRPGLLLTGPVGPVPEYLTAYVSSVVPTPLIATDLLIDPSQREFAGTNLKTVSVARLHKLATLHRRDLVRFLGTLTVGGVADVDARLRLLLNL